MNLSSILDEIEITEITSEGTTSYSGYLKIPLSRRKIQDIETIYVDHVPYRNIQQYISVDPYYSKMIKYTITLKRYGIVNK